jgi:hypothetical protein
MNSKHVQTFLMVSAAFFAINAPVRANSAQSASNTGSNGIIRAAQTLTRTSADAYRDGTSTSISLRAPSGE